MPIRLEYPDATYVDLPENFALDSQSVSLRRTSLRLPGRVGQLPVERPYAEVRRLTVTGVFEGVSADDAESLARLYRGYFLGKLPIKLYRRAGDDKYITIRAVRVADDPQRGRFQGRVCKLTYELEAADPFWYASALTTLTRQVSAAYDRWEITNPGGVAYQQVKVTFTARSGTVINPSLHNSQGGFVAAYTGSLLAGESVVLDGEARTATKGSTNVLALVNAQWQAEGFPLQPGTNILTYQDAATSSHACNVTISWRPAHW